MSAKWIMYIPRLKALASQSDAGGRPSLATRAEGWRSRVESKKVGDDAKYQFSVKFQGDPLPQPLADEDVIYVFGGHGLTGRNGAGWPGDNGNLIDAATIVGRMVADGLPSTFKGRIKVYSCHSGEGGTGAFAACVADQMKTTVPGASVFGYTGEITQSYEEINLEKATHRGKYRGPEADAGTHRWSIVNKPFYAGRTSKNRVEF